MALIAPSILSADFARIGEAVALAEEAGADLVHIDVMDGHFVPNLTLGPQLVASLRKMTRLPLDVHLMVENPRAFIPAFSEAGADWISFHLEASAHLHKDVSLVRELGRKAGLALNPATPVALLEEILPDLDFVLLMSVNPGWGGQRFIPSSRKKIRALGTRIRERGLDVLIELDGGVNLGNFEDLIADGVDVLVAGSAIYAAPDPAAVIRRMKNAAGTRDRARQP
jgi:ribulose-phosphate 3-epimerase